MTVVKGTKPWPQASRPSSGSAKHIIMLTTQKVPVSNESHTQAAVVIIGAGFSGICIAIDLIKRYNCHNFVILEKSTGFGGTWHDNVYPGAACDIPSLLYSYSFEQRSDWSRLYPGQEELLVYLTETAQKYKLYRYVRFASEVSEANWDDATSQWHTKVVVASGTKEHEYSPNYTITSDFLISAVGQLNQPQYPRIPGLDTFAGKTLHSARWDWGYDLKGKKIAVVGNGASAIQLIPELAKVAASLDVYQRTPSWIIPRNDEVMPEVTRNAMHYFPPLRWGIRSFIMNRAETALWNPISHPGSAAATQISDACLAQLEKKLPGPEHAATRAALTPTYPPGCKRILVSDNFYPALALPHVSLITAPIEQIIPAGIATADRNVREYDLIVCATGFKTVEFMHPITFTGRNGTPLADVWRDGAHAYRGVSVPEMPNFATMYGPNTNLGHNSIILMIEAQSRYISRLIDGVLTARGGRSGSTAPAAATPPASLTVKAGPTAAFNARVQQQLSTTAWAAQDCNSWYKDAKSGLIVNNWSAQAIDYQKLMAQITWSDYDGGEEVAGRREETIGRIKEESLWFGEHAMSVWATGAALAGAVAWAGFALSMTRPLQKLLH